MRTQPARIPFASRLVAVAAVITSILPVNALYFYMDAHSPRCFYEELPKDTLVVGHYNAEQWSHQSQTYIPHPDLQITITVDEVFDNDHRIVSQRGGSTDGRFTFTAADSGDHRICFAPSGASIGGGWLSGGQPAHGGIKFSLDMAIGETSSLDGEHKGQMDDLASKVRELNGRIQDIKREQQFQREREAEFRDMSETTNSRVIRWTLIQLTVLGITCAWQLSHLRAFFIKQKLT